MYRIPVLCIYTIYIRYIKYVFAWPPIQKRNIIVLLQYEQYFIIYHIRRVHE